MYYVYILHSIPTSRYYVGHTANVDARLNKHNQGAVRSTKAYKPWEIIYTESFSTKTAAYAREVQIKSYKGGRAFKALLK